MARFPDWMAKTPRKPPQKWVNLYRELRRLRPDTDPAPLEIEQLLKCSTYTALVVREMVKDPGAYGLATPQHPGELPTLDRWDRDQYEQTRQAEGLQWDGTDHRVPIDELLRRRVRRFEEVDRVKSKGQDTIIDVKVNGPIAITHIGDPHLDDDGTNIGLLKHTIETIATTPYMYAGNIGDTLNAWPEGSRLSGLYAHQATTWDEGIRLAVWLLESVPWVYTILGNHDQWGQTATILRQIMKGSQCAVITPGEARITFKFPQGEPIKLAARHNWPGGRSMWNRAHNVVKSSKLGAGGNADILIQGHTHVWACHQHEGDDGRPRTSLIVKGFKDWDSFAEERGFYQHKHGHSCTTILDPTAGPMERVRVVWDIDEAAEMLKYLRRRR